MTETKNPKNKQDPGKSDDHIVMRDIYVVSSSAVGVDIYGRTYWYVRNDNPRNPGHWVAIENKIYVS